jgi:hypothetical protein
VYFIQAVKRVRGMKLIGPLWKPAPAIATAPVPIANHGATTLQLEQEEVL